MKRDGPCLGAMDPSLDSMHDLSKERAELGLGIFFTR